MKNFLFLFAALGALLPAVAQVRVDHLLTENLNNPIGLDAAKPRFSWQLHSGERHEVQTAYEIRVGNDSNALKKGKNTWSSGKITSDQSLHLPYDGGDLASGKRYYWQVRVWDQTGRASAWSAPAFWQMGF